MLYFQSASKFKIYNMTKVMVKFGGPSSEKVVVSIWGNNSQNPFQKLIFSTLMESKIIVFHLFKEFDEVLSLLLILKEEMKKGYTACFSWILLQ